MTLIDTGPLVALCDAKDSHHRLAIQDLKRIGGAELSTCEAVLVEACYHLAHRSQRERLRAVLDRFDIGSMSGTEDRGFRAEVFDWLLKYAEHEPDWTDGCLAVLSGRDPRLKIWTYDREFRTTWRRPDGTAIPLSVKSVR